LSNQKLELGGRMAVRLFVGNLPYSATEAALREHFSAIGPLSYIYLPLDRESGKPRGFAFVEFSDRAQAEAAIRKFNNQLFMGRPLAVNEAREREERPQGAPSRPFIPTRDPLEPPGSMERPANRSFGPDAAPRRTFRKPGGRGGKGERAPKQPIRERPGGRFFGEDTDESIDDDLSGDNFASRVDDEGDFEGDDFPAQAEDSKNE
jgi:RNA recognition motif-containing protein